jgi:hypothetical protein
MTAEGREAAVLRAADLPLLERTYLGVLDTGMVPARLAGDPSLRMDRVTAVCLALREGAAESTYLAGDEPSPAFLAALSEAARSLDRRGVISLAPPPPDTILAPEGLQPPRTPPQAIDFDQHPRIHDRFLAHQCMEELFADARVYPYLMGKYQDSSEVWARLYRERPERFL